MTAPLTDVLRHLRLLVGWSSTAGQTDGKLLERFISLQEEAAFEELLARHGPMVLGVCQQLLSQPHDAEDAFQATFLVLVRRAASIRQRDQLAGWLYGVAHRVAARLQAQNLRRNQRERQGVDLMAAEPSFPTVSDDPQPVIQEKINRLPEKYRLPVLLCCLEGKTQEEAARDLGCSQSAVKGRLERARARLRQRLTRRGVVLSTGSATAIVPPTIGALPPALASGTLQAAILLAAGKSLAAGAASPQVLSLMEGVLRAMFLTKLKIGAAVLLFLGLVGSGLAVSVYRLPAAEQPGNDRTVHSNDATPGSDQPAKTPVARREGSTPLKVQVTYPITRKVVDRQEYVGRTEATTVQVTPGASGELIRVLYRPGERVKKGSLLFEIDPRTCQAELDKARAEYKGAEARLSNAKTALQRLKDLAGKNVVDRSELYRAIANQDESQAALEAAKATLDLAQLHLQATRVAAPMDGTIGQPRVPPGTYVQAGTTLLTTIVATHPIYVNFDMDERTFLQLRKQSARSQTKLLESSVQVGLADETGFPRRGVIDYVADEVNPNTGAIRVRAALSNTDRFLLPGLWVHIRLAVGAPYQALLVPGGIIFNNQGRKWLWVVSAQDTLERRYVVLGPRQDDWQAITEGLTKDGRVICSHDIPTGSLKAGMKIQPEPVKPNRPPETREHQPEAKLPPGQTKR
jgi:RND family efflux transporter MFP subunit